MDQAFFSRRKDFILPLFQFSISPLEKIISIWVSWFSVNHQRPQSNCSGTDMCSLMPLAWLGHLGIYWCFMGSVGVFGVQLSKALRLCWELPERSLCQPCCNHAPDSYPGFRASEARKYPKDSYISFDFMPSQSDYAAIVLIWRL